MGSPEGAAASERRGRIANIFVIVALVAMLLGTVVILAARDTGYVDVAAGEETIAFRYTAPGWDPLGHPMVAKITGTSSYNVTAVETTGTGKGEGPTSGDLEGGRWVRWRDTAQAGESWELHLQNIGNGTLRATHTVSSDLMYRTGGTLVVIGLIGFVFYRRGMA